MWRDKWAGSRFRLNSRRTKSLLSRKVLDFAVAYWICMAVEIRADTKVADALFKLYRG
jgi:hypothetical protein